MADFAPSPKRQRLSLACDECRRRKVKCDAEYPQCRNCRQRDAECKTTDPKRPGAVVVREWIEAVDKAQLSSTTALIASAVMAEEPVAGTKAPNESGQESPRGRENPDPRSNEADHFSPVHQVYDMTFNREHGTHRLKMQGGSSSQCLAKSLDLYFKSAGLKPVSPAYRYGMQHTEEMQIRLGLTLEEFPERPNIEKYMEVYFSRIHMLFPLYDIDDMKMKIHQLAAIPDLTTLPQSQVPWLASAFLIMSIGADESVMRPTRDGERYLYAASNLLTQIVMHPYLPTVQALSLMAICYRGRNKDGIAWQMLGMAIRVAHTLGLQKHSSVKPSNEHVVQIQKERLFHARIWAICCVLEKSMQLECGRPSSIGAINLDQMMSSEQRPPPHIPDFLQWSMRLAEVQEDIVKHIYGHRPGERSAREILFDIATIDKALLAWTNSVPFEFRPGADLLCRNEDFHYAVFLSMSYHSSVIALHRAALIAPNAKFEEEVQKECADLKAQMRLQKGESICINSARSIAKLSMEVLDRKTHSRLLHTGPSLLACIVLAIALVKHPESRLQATDLELLKACVMYTKDQYLATGQDSRFANGIAAIYDEIRTYIQRRPTRGVKRPHESNHRPTSSTHTRQDGVDTSSNLRHSLGPPLQPDRPPPAYQDIALAPHPISMRVSGEENQFYDGPAVDDNHRSEGFMRWADKPSAVFSVVPIAEPTDLFVDENLVQSQKPVEVFDFNAGDGISPNLMLPADSMPFASYNVEDLLNWMLYMDTTDGNSAEDVSSYQST